MANSSNDSLRRVEAFIAQLAAFKRAAPVPTTSYHIAIHFN
ncbi:hypothetical protein F441_00751 [Phytophthora nicotianae CJ01A1]|uniref:Uncharacterized protein n=5 Tax=Phytophthora nicotianae TaxID=4792 RepID=W2RG75_PHYN3|nr:hypothetical protein PPTG_20768 [Phytophthora nicotianae INRA-310]ETI56825.1 hypothetical protein F443_00763 [Phytophthora nicotianae P1569]ETO85559.1 hypothetical protein F444_00764 [Phytophthora nicotianae P1976]ETP26607.1 hypothetical protein F441_00751 [Phytophthora nicotianae CJ01A1]ETP54603.1 hypothetical protein F442_00711 [Phytophthora nicotianae P10297]ETN24226.1 hypothetical protein PPTG_20768 [Phytophthora nicotianae INRA-310]